MSNQTKPKMSCYILFHLNLAYSSIEISQRVTVINSCYYPILQVTRDAKIPIAVEASGYTLQAILEANPAWIDELKNLKTEGLIEFVGSGFCQIIGPLVPHDVLKMNLELGNESYSKILDFVPDIYFVNEQAFSKGIVPSYLESGAKALVMEWNNPFRNHPEWRESDKFFPKRVIGTQGTEISVIWNDSIAFQKLQRYAHGEIEDIEYLNFFNEQKSLLPKNGVYSIYGNDAEIFDFRPQRYKTEPKLGKEKEWHRLEKIFRKIKNHEGMSIIPLSKTLDFLVDEEPIDLCSAAIPIPVKKQPKYSLTRWSVTGCDDVGINTDCYKIHKILRCISERGNLSGHEVKRFFQRLCYLWSSDFRTHITQKRWTQYKKDLSDFLGTIEKAYQNVLIDNSLKETIFNVNGGVVVKRELGSESFISRTGISGHAKVKKEGRFVTVGLDQTAVALNCRRGLAIESLSFPKISPKALCGSIPHGFYKEINLSPDWYTWDVVIQPTGRPQITDLEQVDFKVFSVKSQYGSGIQFLGSIKTEIGIIEKVITVFDDIPSVLLELVFGFEEIPLGAFRVGIVTILPKSFDEETLFYATHNGGSEFEIYSLSGNEVEHSKPATSVVSASSGIGATEELIVVGDKSAGLCYQLDHAVSASLPMITYKDQSDYFYLSIECSLGEVDESRPSRIKSPRGFRAAISPLVYQK